MVELEIVKREDYGELYAVCRNYPEKCSSCTRLNLWSCPITKEQPPEIESAIRSTELNKAMP
jgi:hypothetical protein